MKRFVDMVLGIIFLVLLLPVILGVALAVLLNLGRPVLYRQTRPGLNGVPFRLIKFRTMSFIHHANGSMESDEDRLGKVGKWLRKSSLDELPELINIIRGDMTFVGPRPLLMEYLPLYNAVQARRHSVKPGLTGWAQVNGRNTLSWNERLALDNWYVDNRSFFLDVRIMFLTLLKVLRREGISQDGHATMEPFRGSRD